LRTRDAAEGDDADVVLQRRAAASGDQFRALARPDSERLCVAPLEDWAPFENDLCRFVRGAVARSREINSAKAVASIFLES
jgi:hypothetical protein